MVLDNKPIFNQLETRILNTLLKETNQENKGWLVVREIYKKSQISQQQNVDKKAESLFNKGVLEKKKIKMDKRAKKGIKAFRLIPNLRTYELLNFAKKKKNFNLDGIKKSYFMSILANKVGKRSLTSWLDDNNFLEYSILKLQEKRLSKELYEVRTKINMIEKIKS